MVAVWHFTDDLICILLWCLWFDKPYFLRIIQESGGQYD